MIANEETLKRLMIKSQAGDKQCYHSLLTECERWLRRYFARKIAPFAVDDLVQERPPLHRKRASYNPERPFLPWLAAIGRYRWIDHLRKVYRNDAVELNEDLTADPQGETITARVSLDRLLSMLPKGQAEVIRLVKIKGLSIEEAADQTQQSQSLVKVNIHRGLKKMAGMVET
ncbi:MAG: sigma-70 family RNA polymerase sigma factor [Parasphingorhabdus sp.]|nr:sigma-70 family RNA polymerase sigma factor [Parasphingorhabdus sp.]